MVHGSIIEEVGDNESYRRSLHEQMLGLARRRAALDAEELDALVEVKRLALWRHYGCATALEYMERVLGYSPHTAAERLRVAHELQELPALKQALRESRLPFSAVRELTRIVVPETQEAWLREAAGKNVRQIEDLVAHHCKGDLPTDQPDPTPKRCVLRFTELSPETLAMMREARRRIQDEMGGTRIDDDTFLQMLMRESSAPSNDVTPPAYQIAITTCKECRQSVQNGAGVAVRIDDAVRERAECDAMMLGDLDAPAPERITQSVTPRKRRQVFARDQFRCRVPGCRSSRGLDIHHIQLQSNGGTHDLWNLCLLCSGHHAQLHDGNLRLSGRAPDALHFEWRYRDWWMSKPPP